MSTKPAKPDGSLRRRRQEIDLSRTIIVGDERLTTIVYCYRFPSRPDRLKIGYSSRGLVRVSEQSTGFPEKPIVVFVIHDKRAKALEEAFHMALSHRQSDVMGTEWFDVSFKDVLKVSPALRRAVGFRRIEVGVRRAVSIGLMLVGAGAYPLTVGLAAGFHDPAAILDILPVAREYVQQLGEASLRDAFETGRWLFQDAVAETSTPIPLLVAALHVPLLGSLAWFRAKPQVG